MQKRSRHRTQIFRIRSGKFLSLDNFLDIITMITLEDTLACGQHASKFYAYNAIKIYLIKFVLRRSVGAYSKLPHPERKLCTASRIWSLRVSVCRYINWKLQHLPINIAILWNVSRSKAKKKMSNGIICWKSLAEVALTSNCQFYRILSILEIFHINVPIPL